jgi:chromosomal replication initiation ATPase DnaA
MKKNQIELLKIEKHLITNFLEKFHSEIGYYPTVLTKYGHMSGDEKVKLMKLNELEELFESFLPIYYEKKQKLSSRSRTRRIVDLRFIFYFIGNKMLGYKLTEIARYLKKDHTTIIHGLRQYNNLYETNPFFKEQTHQIINLVKNKQNESQTLDVCDKT